MVIEQRVRGAWWPAIWTVALAGCSDSGADGPGADATTTGLQSAGATAGETSSGGMASTASVGGASDTTVSVTTGGATTGPGSSTTTTSAATTTSVTTGAGGTGADNVTAGPTTGADPGGAGGADGTGATGGATSTDATTGDLDGPCTASQPTGTNASGSGPYAVIVETNSDPGINEGTIFRPAELGGAEKYPIFVWGQGACSRDGLANATAMAEIASHGYFVVADGTPNGSGSRPMDRSDLDAMGAPLIAYIDWALDENRKPCSAYYRSLDATKISSNGFSCGGLMAQGTVTDPRIVTWGVTSSGMAGATQAFYDYIQTPVLFVEGGPAEVAYDGGLQGYQAISALGVPVLWFSKDIGHGGDLFTPDGGDFTRINLAWLNWWLKGDEGATGKGLLVGDGCPYCSDPEWEVMSANLP